MAGMAGEGKFEKGFAYAAWWKDFYSKYGRSSLEQLKSLGVEWIAIYVVWYQDKFSSPVMRSDPNRTPTDASLRYVINTAHTMGLKVMLKPHVRLEDGNSRDKIAPKDWDRWFENYRTFIIRYAKLASQLKVEQFCVGTELSSTEALTEQWRRTIDDVRAVYSGALTYAATRRTYQEITWWDTLDYVGIDAYFHVSTAPNSAFEDVLERWKIHIYEMETWQATVGMPIILTEIGYSSYDGTTMHPEKGVTDEPVDLQEQAMGYHAAMASLFGRSWLRGIFWHYWDPRASWGGPTDRNFTPQNKPAEKIVGYWYHLDWDSPEMGAVSNYPSLSQLTRQSTD